MAPNSLILAHNSVLPKTLGKIAEHPEVRAILKVRGSIECHFCPLCGYTRPKRILHSASGPRNIGVVSDRNPLVQIWALKSAELVKQFLHANPGVGGNLDHQR